MRVQTMPCWRTFPDGSINFPLLPSVRTPTQDLRTASGTVALISDGTKVAQFPAGQGTNGQALIGNGSGVLSYSNGCFRFYIQQCNCR